MLPRAYPSSHARWHRQLDGLKRVSPSEIDRSEAGREASHLGPDLNGFSPGLPMSDGVGVSGAMEEVSNLIVNGEKSLGLTG
jgi:hypothetical protein